MATNVELLDQLSEIFVCKLCCKQFEDPIMLRCSHRLCRGCLADMIQKGLDFYCPDCRQKVDMTEKELNELKSDVLVENIIECLQKSKPFKGNDRERTCGPCSKRDIAAGYCFKCANYLCETCCADHNINENFRDHANFTISLSDEILRKMDIYKITHSRRCKHHLENFLDEICTQCNDVPICITCRYGDHIGHKTKDIKAKAEENVDRLKKEIQALSEKMEKLYYRIGSAKLLREDVNKFASQREELIKSSFTQGTEKQQTECEDTTRTLEARRRKIIRGEMDHLGSEECKVRLSEINASLKKCDEKYRTQLKRTWQRYYDDMSRNESVKNERHEKLVCVMEHGWVTERRWRVVGAVLSTLIDWSNDWLMVTFLPDLFLVIKAINEDIDLKKDSGDLEAVRDSLKIRT